MFMFQKKKSIKPKRLLLAGMHMTGGGLPSGPGKPIGQDFSEFLQKTVGVQFVCANAEVTTTNRTTNNLILFEN
jgi:hypothetical protein